MLILPPGHAQNIRERRAFRVRERWMIGGVLASLAALAVALVIAVASPSPKSGHGCISVALAYSTGGALIHRCGGSARTMCAEVGKPGGLKGQAGETVTSACRKAGLPVG